MENFLANRWSSNDVEDTLSNARAIKKAAKSLPKSLTLKMATARLQKH
jgi:hypothetical protein